MDWQAVDFLGVRVARIDRVILVGQVLDWSKGSNQHTVTYVNANCLDLAAKYPEYRNVLNHTDLVYVDGIGIVWAGRLLGLAGFHKVTGRSWIDEFCHQGELQGLRLYLLAGKPGVAERARCVLESRYPELVITGCADGYFQTKSEEQVLAELAKEPPHVLMVGMGAPAQEYWVSKHRDRISAKVCWCVGALFDYVAGIEKPVPGWLDKLGLEWLWRFKEDPGGKWRRYLFGIPRFIGRVIWQGLKFR